MGNIAERVLISGIAHGLRVGIFNRAARSSQHRLTSRRRIHVFREDVGEAETRHMQPC